MTRIEMDYDFERLQTLDNFSDIFWPHGLVST